MPNDIQPYRTPHESDEQAGPREDLGEVEVPVVGAVAGAVRLDRPFHLEVDRHEASLQPAGGLVLRAADLPTVDVRGVRVDLVDGLVRTEAAALGAFFDRVLTVALCSALRQVIGWRPGVSMTGRLPRSRRVQLEQDTRLAVDVGGEAASVSLSRPARLRFFGLPVRVSALRYEFATAKISAETQGVGPVRRALLRLLAWGATRWLRPKLPAALRQPGYDLFADGQRRRHIQQLIARLRGQKKDAEDEAMGAGAGRPGHALARAGKGDRAGFLGLFSAGKAAVVAALASLRISADDVPEQTRVLVRLPLGPLSRVALCTDRGGEVVVTKYRGGLRLEAPLGVYLFADQFPELAELRLTRVDVDLSRKREVGLDIQTEPPLGPLARALLTKLVDAQVKPRLPGEAMAAGGVWDDGPDHVLWRQELGPERSLLLRTRRDAEVKVRHTDEELVVEAPAGLEAIFGGVPVPGADIRRLAYRWEDGSLAVEGTPELGAFGRTLGESLLRVRAAPHLPKGAGVHAEAPADFDPSRQEQFAVVLAGLPVPLLGRVELRMDPLDTLQVGLGPALLTVRSERGLLLVAPDLRLALHVRSARYDLPAKALFVDATPSPGPFVTATAAQCLDALVVPLLRKAVALAPDAAAGERWVLFEGMGVRVTLPPGATLTAKRTVETLELAGSAPIEVDGQGGAIADFTIDRLRWLAAEDRLVVDSTPAAGELMNGVVRRALDRAIPDVIAKAVAGRLGLPAPKRQDEPEAPTLPPLFTAEVANLGPVSLHVDAHAGISLTMRRAGAELTFAGGATVRAERFAAQVVVRRVRATFLPFTLAVDSEPAMGELEDHLLAQVARTLLAPAMRMLWPADRAPQAGRDVLLALGPDASWGPIELCVPGGGEFTVDLDHEGAALRSAAGVYVAGLEFLPAVGVHALTVRWEDGAVDLTVGEVEERFFHEAAAVSETTKEIASRLLAVYVLSRAPAWAQRLGVRVLPPPPPLPDEPGRKLVLDTQLPGGLAKLAVRMDPMDLLELRASRVEVAFTSELGLHLDLENLGLRVPVYRARYHMLSGELQLGDLGRFENAVAEGLVRQALAALDGKELPADEVTLLDVIDRFPLADGKRILFGDKVVQVRMAQESVIVVRVGTKGLMLTVDPPVEIDGPAVLNFVLHGLRYDFEDAEFHLDWKHDGVISRMFSGTAREEGEMLLNNLRPALPAAMRTPGYSLASDPDPRATLGHLVRTVSRRRPPPAAE